MSDKLLAGKTLFVTGGNTGIGLATAMAFAARGGNVALYARRRAHNVEALAQLQAVGGGGRHAAYDGDVTDEQQLKEALQAAAHSLGGLHYAFNNAGADQRAVVTTELTADDYAVQMDV